MSDNDKPNSSPSAPHFLWNNDSLEKYTKNINSCEFITKFNEFVAKDFTDCNAAVDSFKTIIQDAASKSAKIIRKNLKQTKKYKKNKPWFTDSCRDLHTSVKNYAKLVNKHPYNGHYRASFYKLKSKLRRACKSEEKKFKKRIQSDIYNNMDKDPKSFWSLINNLDKHAKNNSDEHTCNKEFTNFFKNLYKVDHSSNKNHDELEKKNTESSLNQLSTA